MTARAIVAELLGSMLLAACVVGSGVMAERLAEGNLAVALLANTLATCGILVALILSFGNLSGAHFNPAVSLVMTMQGSLPRRLLVGYILAQIIGMLGGVVLAHAMFELPILQVSTHIRAGAGQWLSEALATFVLLLTILRCARTHADAVPYAVAAAILAGYWFTASTSFANPAITIARAYTDSFAGIAPAGVLGFIMAQLIGAIAAYLIERWLSATPAHR
jgi:glycerol uptake facilitator-like aquaporin